MLLKSLLSSFPRLEFVRHYDEALTDAVDRDHDPPRAPTPRKSYNLVTEPGFLSQMAFWTAAQVVLFKIAQSSGLLSETVLRDLQTSTTSSLSLPDLILSTLSGCCCGIQLILNLFSFGCAGFNTVLGPWRPCFLSATLLTQAFSWSNLCGGQKPSSCECGGTSLGGGGSSPSGAEEGCAAWVQPAIATGLVLLLSFLPELVFLATRNKPNKPPRRANPRSDSDKKNLLLVQADNEEQDHSDVPLDDMTRVSEDSTHSRPVRRTATLRTQGMGCVACVHAVQNVVRAFPDPSIVDVEVDLAEGKVFVTLVSEEREAGREQESSGAGEDELLSRLVEAVSDAGFDSEVLEVRDHKKWSQEGEKGDATPGGGGAGACAA